MSHEAIQCYLNALQARGAAPATLKASRADLTHLAQWWETRYRRTFDPSQLVERDLRAWKVARQKEEGAAPSTINRGLSTVRRFSVWATEQGILTENPAVAVTDVSSEAISPRSLPDEVVDALLRAVHQEKRSFLRARDGALLALLAYAGLRAQEACDVQLRDLDLAGGAVTVRSGKGGKARRVPLHSDAQRLLESYLNQVRCPDGLPPIGSETEREPLLAGQQVIRAGRPTQPGITTGLVRHRIHLFGQRAAAQMRTAAAREPDIPRRESLLRFAQMLEETSPHMLRHSLARRLLRTGAQLSEVQRVLGHSRLSTTGVYLTPSEDDLRQAMERAGV